MELEDGAEDDVQDVSYGFEYDFVTPNVPYTETALPASKARLLDETAEPEEPEYQFRLFAPGPKSKAQSDEPECPFSDTRVKLSASPEPAELTEPLSLDRAHFIRPNRPDLYYLTSALSQNIIEGLKSQYEDAAISTSDVLSRAISTMWPGTALPWRVIEVELLNKPSKSKGQAPNDSQETGRARSRPSKKRRILFRRRLVLRAELAAQSKVAEETEREKRTRRNREKKVKKKEREKKKKVEADGVGDVTAAEDAMEQNINDPDTRKSAVAASSPQPGTGTTAQDSPHPTTTEQKDLGAPPTRRAPTSRAPTAAATVAPTATKAKARAPTSVHPTRPRS